MMLAGLNALVRPVSTLLYAGLTEDEVLEAVKAIARSTDDGDRVDHEIVGPAWARGGFPEDDDRFVPLNRDDQTEATR